MMLSQRWIAVLVETPDNHASGMGCEAVEAASAGPADVDENSFPKIILPPLWSGDRTMLALRFPSFSIVYSVTRSRRGLDFRR
jgi:hypothetical protein